MDNIIAFKYNAAGKSFYSIYMLKTGKFNFILIMFTTTQTIFRTTSISEHLSTFTSTGHKC